MRKIFILFLMSFLFGQSSMAQCPVPNNNFQNFGQFNLTPTGIGDTVRSLHTWGGDYHHVNVESGKTYVISGCETVVSTQENYAIGELGIFYEPIMTIYRDTQGTPGAFNELSGPILDYAYKNCSTVNPHPVFGDGGNRMPVITYTADFTGNLAVALDPYVNCDSFAVDSAIIFITEIPTPSPCSANSPIPTATGTYSSTQSAIDGNWTHYCDATGNLLLSLDVGTSGAVIADNEVSLEITSPTAEYHTQDCGASPPCFIDLANGAIAFNRKWDVNPTTQPSTGNVGVRSYFTQAEYDAVNTEIANQGQTQLTGMEEMWFYKVTNASLGQFPAIPNITASDVLTLGNHATTPSTSQWVLSTKTAASEFIAEYEVSSFSGGGGGGAGSGARPLPVELVYFHAYIDDEVTQLKWATASETNNRGFEIQKSKDGLDWEKIGFAEGKGHSTTLSEYYFTDENPYVGENYYRLKQIDLDGKFEVLPIQVVNMESDKNAPVTIFPNPAKDFLNITNIKGQGMLYSISGQHLQTFDLNQDGINTIAVSDLEKGVYNLVLIRENGERIIKRFLK